MTNRVPFRRETGTDEDEALAWCDMAYKNAATWADLDWHGGKQGTFEELRWPHILKEHVKLTTLDVPPRYAMHPGIRKLIERMRPMAR